MKMWVKYSKMWALIPLVRYLSATHIVLHIEVYQRNLILWRTVKRRCSQDEVQTAEYQFGTKAFHPFIV